MVWGMILISSFFFLYGSPVVPAPPINKSIFSALIWIALGFSWLLPSSLVSLPANPAHGQLLAVSQKGSVPSDWPFSIFLITKVLSLGCLPWYVPIPSNKWVSLSWVGACGLWLPLYSILIPLWNNRNMAFAPSSWNRAPKTLVFF